MTNKIMLPPTNECDAEPIITSIIAPLNLPREALASNEDIETVWMTLTPHLNKVHPEYRHELLVRMVVAIRVGLFSSAVNEIWNTTILALRQKIKDFGYLEAKQFLGKDINERVLKEAKDFELLNYCLKLGLIDDRSYFFLNHSREIRNNYSSAHPSDSPMLDGTELNTFIHHCIKYVLSKTDHPVGVNINRFMESLKAKGLGEDAFSDLANKVKTAHELQQSAILKAIFGIYCNDTNEEDIRTNSLKLAQKTWDYYDETAVSEILSLFSEYLIDDSNKKEWARHFFEKVNALRLLPKDEQVSLFHRIIKQLETTHHNFDNFFNEYPIADRLESISKSLPDSIRKEYVYTVSLCYIGNQYGTARSAEPYYKKMISNFNQKDVSKLFDLLKEKNYLRNRIKNFERCKKEFRELLLLIDDENIPSTLRAEYERYIGE